MKKFLSALIALTMAVAPTGTNICGAEGTAYLEKKESVSKKQKNEVSKKISNSVKSFKEVVREHGKEIGLGVAGTAAASLLTWNGYNLVKNSDKVKEILVDPTLSVKEKIQAIAKVVFCGVKKVVISTEKQVTPEEQNNTESQNNTEDQAEEAKKAEEAKLAEEAKKAEEATHSPPKKKNPVGFDF